MRPWRTTIGLVCLVFTIGSGLLHPDRTMILLVSMVAFCVGALVEGSWSKKSKDGDVASRAELEFQHMGKSSASSRAPIIMPSVQLSKEQSGAFLRQFSSDPRQWPNYMVIWDGREWVGGETSGQGNSSALPTTPENSLPKGS